nr:MAG TPA: hemolysin [Caudoviricetes sp.]
MSEKDTGITEKLANLTESQSYMAVEFEKMQEDIRDLKEWKFHFQNNFKVMREYNQSLDKRIDKVKLISIVCFIFTLVITILGAIYHK